MTDVNKLFNNNLGVVANSAIPPDLPPSGVYDTKVKPAYKFDPVAVQNLLLDAMKNPLTKFRLSNGTLAKTGTFDNSFGCATLNSKNQCDSPVGQTIQMYFPTGDTFHEQVFTQIAGAVNNVSETYNMGLTAAPFPLPPRPVLTQSLGCPVDWFAVWR